MRLLAGVRPDRPLTLAEHHAVHGPMRLDRDLLDEVRAAGLTGRGGAGFPVARKLETAARSRGRAVVVVNAAESEPASAKDETLLRGSPHLVLDGAEAAATALGTRTAYVWVHRGADRMKTALDRALAQRPTTLRSLRVRVVDGPDRYVAGDASAAVRRISGGPSLPTVSPYRTAERGVHGRPTFVANVETYGHLALLSRHGASWFREAGTDDEPGTLLVTVREASAPPRVVEVAAGTPLTEVLRDREPAGVLVGGYGGAWLAADKVSAARLSRAALSALGGDLGVGLVLTIPRDHCPLAETERLLWWLASESTGQCGPCVNGLPELARRFADVVRRGNDDDVATVERVGGLVRGRGACSAPDGAVRLAESAVREFADHVRRHAADGACSGAAVAPLAPLPPRAPVSRGELWR
jgi:NADH:ubiquinone oxidoreductase subunit F (NADH-binding)